MSGIRAWRERHNEELLDCRIFRVERSTCESPADGTDHAFFRILSVDWAQVVPVTADQHIVMVRQFRHGSGQITLEIPGGLVEAGEDPAASAARECLEETGYRVGELRSLGVVNPNPALFANRLHSYAAESAVPVAPVRNEGAEQTEVVLVPAAELPQLLRSGRIDHALVAATLWRFVHEYL